jgi:hypothetical protein
LQYSLPQNLSEFDHPSVRDYQPPLKTRSDAKYRQIIDWMGMQLKAVDPTYTFDPAPATQAASEPATVPAPAPPSPPTANEPVRPQPRPAPPARGAVPPPPPGGVLR